MVLAKPKSRSLHSPRKWDCTKYGYDAVGQRLVLDDSTGRTTTTFDLVGRIFATRNPDNKRITYGYDVIGQRLTMRDPDNGRFTYTYDSASRISTLRNPQEDRTTFIHDAAGRRTVTKLANLVRASVTYDTADRLVTLANVKADGNYVSRYDYTYDNTQNKIRVLEADGNRVTWSYDRTYQLTREQRSGSNAYDTTYTYDVASNRRLEINDTARTTYTCDNANQLQWTEDATGRTTYSFDNAGNQTVSRTPANVRVTQTWDAENRMIRVRQSTTRSTYLYNGDSLRIRADESTGTSKIIWDGQIYLVETNSAGTTQAVYSSEPTQYGYLLSQRRTSSNYYHVDAPGSVTNLTNSTAAITDSYLYKAFGVSVASSGTTANPFRFIGQQGYYLSNINSYYVRRRWLRVDNSMWTTVDPFFIFSKSLYSYVNNNPVNHADPSGLIPECNPCDPCKCTGLSVTAPSWRLRYREWEENKQKFKRTDLGMFWRASASFSGDCNCKLTSKVKGKIWKKTPDWPNHWSIVDVIEEFMDDGGCSSEGPLLKTQDPATCTFLCDKEKCTGRISYWDHPGLHWYGRDWNDMVKEKFCVKLALVFKACCVSADGKSNCHSFEAKGESCTTDFANLPPYPWPPTF